MSDLEWQKFAYVERASWKPLLQAVWGVSWKVCDALKKEESLEEMLAHPQIRVDEGVSDILTRFNALQNNKWGISLEILLWRLFDDKLDSAEGYIVLTSWEYAGNEVLFMERIVVVGNQYARKDGYIVGEWVNQTIVHERMKDEWYSGLTSWMKEFLGLK